MREDQRHPLLYVALGDSLTVGIGTLFKPGFVQQYKKKAEHALKRNIQLKSYAKNGTTSTDIRHIMSNAQLQHDLQRAHLITLSVGGNDLRKASKPFLKTCHETVLQQALKEFRRNMSHIMTMISTLKKDQKQGYIIRLLEIYNPYPHLKVAEKWIKKFNQELKRFEEQPTVKVIPVYKAFKGREGQVLWIDRLHPNAKGYEVIAEELDKAGYYPLLKKKSDGLKL
ncbi:spore germination lipase LipC [Caldalkalibacillus thermarum]|uniref:GDSL-type esterase/lipase family protein n=1 Tax=Caldalkalibacillus thermarum TaxID=296745 RepID=UPI00166CE398|nr:GDSL-type esterase/lipase family protein [Caldalkalibacillus thermarum]GGK32253.1 spore germination lipase LipC [Caldalkalibacillus thermarum]